MSYHIFDARKLNAEIYDCGVLAGLMPGAAREAARSASKEVAVWVEKRGIVTDKDIERILLDTLDKSYPDIAFAYRNRDKII